MINQTHSTSSPLRSGSEGQAFILPPLPKILPGKEVYNSIMQQIEPELLSGLLSSLKTKYKSETAEAKEKRRKRYNAAVKKYHGLYTAYISDLDARIHRYQKEAMRSIEDRSHAQEEKQLENLEASIFKLT